MYLNNPPPKQDLPILAKTSEAYKLWHSYLINLPKTDRYTLGSKADSALIEVLELFLIAKIANKSQKLDLINRASAKLDVFKFFLQILWEIKILNNQKYQQLSILISEIGRMLGGWQKQLQKETPPK